MGSAAMIFAQIGLASTGMIYGEGYSSLILMFYLARLV